MLNAKNVLYELWYAAYLFQVLVGFGGRLLKVLDDALSHLEPEGVCHVQHVLLLVLSPCLPHVPPLLACLPLPCEVELGGSGHPILQVESLYLEVGLVNHSLKVDVVWCGHLAIILMPVHGGSVEDGTHSNSVIHFKLPGVLHDGGVERHKSSLNVLSYQIGSLLNVMLVDVKFSQVLYIVQASNKEGVNGKGVGGVGPLPGLAQGGNPGTRDCLHVKMCRLVIVPAPALHKLHTTEGGGGQDHLLPGHVVDGVGGVTEVTHW